VLTRASLTDILEHYAQIVEEKDERTGKKHRKQVFPRYHQLTAVRALLADVRTRGVGHRYLVQHSPGSGKSNSIAWAAHQLTELEDEGVPLFDSVVVVTDRTLLDRQIRDTLRQFTQVSSILGHARHGGDLRRFIASGKRIIVSTVQKFPVIVAELGAEHRGRRFAILIDEAHSSQGGRAATQMNMALSPDGEEIATETMEDAINRLMESGKMLANASCFAFTATPKPKTAQVFGERVMKDGKECFEPFHSYTMKQAIEERFIMDVLANYTPVPSFYRLAAAADEDPLFDKKEAVKKLRHYVEGLGTCVLDFYNDADSIQTAFQPYYRTTILSGGTHPNRLHDLQADLDRHQVYTQDEIDELVTRYLASARRDRLDPILDRCRERYQVDLDADGQIDFKGKAKAFLRTYGFLSAILPFSRAPWEKLSIFLHLLLPRLPAPRNEDREADILALVDMDSYRSEMQATLSLRLEDADGTLDPYNERGGGRKPEPELERLSKILREFNERWGNIAWEDRDRIAKVIAEEIPAYVAGNSAYRNAMHNANRDKARIEHDTALRQVILGMFTDHQELFKRFQDDDQFRDWLSESVFAATYQPGSQATA